MNHSEYFNKMYHRDDDPWGYNQLWYEQRKKQICLAVLTQPRYGLVLEMGCSNGHLSEHLAQRADQLICMDVSDQAVQLATQRLQVYSHVEVQNKKLPEAFPEHRFDLIVISEVAYYLSMTELNQLIECLKTHLSENGEILCCHWRYAIDHFELDAEKVHHQFKKNLSLKHYLSLNDSDFMIDLWTINESSLAQQEGLI